MSEYPFIYISCVHVMNAIPDKSFCATCWASRTPVHAAMLPYKNPPNSSTHFYVPTSGTAASLLHMQLRHGGDTYRSVSAYKAAHPADFAPYNRFATSESTNSNLQTGGIFPDNHLRSQLHFFLNITHG